MTDELANVYDRAFFRDYSAENPAYADACAYVAEVIFERFGPKTAIDWGCGAGLHVAALRALGVDAIGVDGVVLEPDQRAPDVDIREADLRYPVPAGIAPSSYDLALCVDVLEHLEDRDSAAALDNICRGAGLVILSCAPPGQGGHHHVNERPRRYWVARMAEIGWTYDRRATGAMERHFLGNRSRVPLSWMYHNLCVYRPARKSG